MVSDPTSSSTPDGRLLTAVQRPRRCRRQRDRPRDGRPHVALDAPSSRSRRSARATTADGTDRVAAVIDDLEHPAEVHVGDVSDGAIAWRTLTSIHAQWTDVERGEARQVTWTASDGQTIQGFLFLPPGGRTAPADRCRSSRRSTAARPAASGSSTTTATAGRASWPTRVSRSSSRTTAAPRAGASNSPRRTSATWAAPTSTTSSPASTHWSRRASPTRTASASAGGATAGS